MLASILLLKSGAEGQSYKHPGTAPAGSLSHAQSHTGHKISHATGHAMRSPVVGKHLHDYTSGPHLDDSILAVVHTAKTTGKGVRLLKLF